MKFFSLFIFAILARADDMSFEQQMAVCSAPVEVSQNTNLDVRSLEKAVEDAKNKKKAQCQGVATLNANNESLVAQVKNAPEQIGTFFTTSWQKADGAIAELLLHFSETTTQLWQIPNAPSDQNNQIFKKVEDLFISTQSGVDDLDKSWDSLLTPALNSQAYSAIQSLKKASQNSMWSASARRIFSDYLDKIPPYLRGEGQAPKDKIKFLADQEALIRREFTLKNAMYSQVLINQADSDVQEIFRPDVLKSKAQVLRRGLISIFKVYTLTWAMLAKGSGSCELSRTIMNEQLDTLKMSIELSPDNLKPFVMEAVAKDVSDRQNFLKSLSCKMSVDQPLVVLNIGRLQKLIPDLCQAAKDDIKLSVDSWIETANLYMSELPKRTEPQEPEAMHSLGQEFWNRGYYLLGQCKGVRP